MPRLMDRQIILPGVEQKTWLHSDGAGNDNITIEVVQDAAPVIRSIRQEVELAKRRKSSDVRLMSRVPLTELQDVAKGCAQIWGVRLHQAFSEIMNGKTDRAQRVLKNFAQGRDYRRLQTKSYS